MDAFYLDLAFKKGCGEVNTRIGLILTLLCASVVLAQSQSCDWTAKWDMSSGASSGWLVLQQSDNTVTGSEGSMQIQGSVSGNHLAGNWKTPGDAGTFDLKMATDCQSFTGNWRYGSSGEWAGDWTGTRVAGTSNPTGTSNPDLSGTWNMGGPINVGQPCKISQEGSTLTFTNENGAQSAGKFVDAKTVIATDWENGLRGTISTDGNRIDWANGSWWTRYSYPDLSGTWYMGGPINVGQSCKISQEGSTLTFTNENGSPSPGNFVDSKTVEATGWNGLRGTLSSENKRIDWANGSWWTR
jgi:hypothetical protein